MADRILATVKVLQTPSDKVQMCDGVEGEKSKREVVFTDRPATWGAGVHEALPAQVQT